MYLMNMTNDDRKDFKEYINGDGLLSYYTQNHIPDKNKSIDNITKKEFEQYIDNIDPLFIEEIDKFIKDGKPDETNPKHKYFMLVGK